MSTTLFRTIQPNHFTLLGTALFRTRRTTRHISVRCLNQTATTQEPKPSSQPRTAPKNHGSNKLDEILRDYEAVIGIETHVQLSTSTKAFCSCPNSYGSHPNTSICPVCMGLPGALPVLSSKVVDFGVRLGLALNCDLSLKSKFDRKQ